MAGLSLADLTPQHTAEKIIIYGQPKTGKTSLAGLLGEFYNIHYIGFEGGHTAFKSANFPAAVHNNLHIYPVRDTRKYPTGIETAINIFRSSKTEWCLEHGKVTGKLGRCPVCKSQGDKGFVTLDMSTMTADKDILVFDSGSQLTDSMKNLLLGKDIDDLTYEALQQKLEYSHYEAMGKLSREFLNGIQACPLNVILITHESENKNEDGTKQLMPVFGTSNFALQVGRYFDHVLYTELKNGKYKVVSTPTYRNSVQAGTRSGLALETLDQPSLAKLFGKDAKLSLGGASAAKPGAASGATKPASGLIKR